MGHKRSLGERVRSWLGVQQLDPDRFAFLTKLERAEEDVALMRLVVILVNALVFLTQGALGGPTPPAAVAVLVLVFGYGVTISLVQVRPTFGTLPWSVATAGLDALAISAWLAATGGWASPYFPVWYASIAAVAYRYNLPLTTAVSTAYVGAYAGLCLATGGVGSWIEFGLRAAYIPITGAIVGLASEGYVDAQHEHRGIRRRLRAALRGMDRGFTTLLSEAPDRIVVTDTEGRVAFANTPVDALGFATDEEPRACGVHQGALRTAQESGDVVDYVASPQQAGASDTFWCRVAPVQPEEAILGAVIVARPTPDRRDASAEGEHGNWPVEADGSSRPSDPWEG